MNAVDKRVLNRSRLRMSAQLAEITGAPSHAEAHPEQARAFDELRKLDEVMEAQERCCFPKCMLEYPDGCPRAC